MADGVTLDSGTGGAVIKTDDDGSFHWQLVKVAFGGDNTQTEVTASVGLPVALLAGTAEFGKLAAGTAEIGSVKWAGTAPPIGAGTEAAALRVTLATDSTGVITVDNGGTFATQATCTNAGTFATQATLQAGTAEFGKLAAGVAEIGNVKNSGTFAVQAAIDELPAAAAITDNFANPTTSNIMSMGMAWDGATWDRMKGDATDGLLVNLGTNNDITVTSGTITAVTTITNDVNIADGGNSITVDNGGTFAVQSTLTAETTKVIGTVNVAAAQTIAVTNAGTFATQATLQAGTAEIGKLAAGVAVIGEVTIGAATGATGDLAKTQDVAMGANDVGMAMLAVGDDEQAAMTPADGDYTTLRTDKFGNLKVTNLPDATSIIKFGVIDDALSGDNTLQAAAGAGIKIRVLSVMMVSAGTVTARFESGAGGTALTGQMNLVANSGFTLPYNPAGWFETADNALLNLELSGAISVDGCFTYVEV